MFLFIDEAFNILRWKRMQVFIKSFGCSANLTDGEVLAGCLADAGYKLVKTVEAAHLVIYNTCAVKGPTENRMITILKRVPPDKKLIVAGCLPLINFERLRKEVYFHGVVGPAAADKIVDVVKRVLNGEKVVALEGAANAKPSLNLPRLRLNPVIGIIPINYGCLGSCAYCCVVFARGHLRSYSIQEIIERLRTDLSSGVREFWITSQDTACYGRDIGTSLANLLKALCNVKRDFKIRVGMMTPNLAKNILEELIQAFESEKIFKFLHLPVQSGDDKVLKRMRRLYSVEDFKDIVNAFRARFPDITLATDVICGFPSETKEAFERTLRLVENAQPDIVNVSKFFARPKTTAAEMREGFVSSQEIKRRSGLTAKLAKEVVFERNQRWVGWTGEILVDEVGKVSGSWIGRNFAYKPIVLKNSGSGDLIGKTFHVKIVKAFGTYLEGKIVE
jgi:threonylcarbamoyladenosine tRNA methylthiotransferase CDKAL1